MAYETYHTPAKYLENYERLIEATWERKLASRSIHPAEFPEMSVGSAGGPSPISSGETLCAHSKKRALAHPDEAHDPPGNAPPNPRGIQSGEFPGRRAPNRTHPTR